MSGHWSAEHSTESLHGLFAVRALQVGCNLGWDAKRLGGFRGERKPHSRALGREVPNASVQRCSLTR